jgi:hypothetical protein
VEAGEASREETAMNTDNYYADYQPDYHTEAGVPVWVDVSDLHHACDMADEPTDYPERGYVCAETAERRIGDHHACNYHFARAHAAADDDTAYGRALDYDLARLD